MFAGWDFQMTALGRQVRLRVSKLLGTVLLIAARVPGISVCSLSASVSLNVFLSLLLKPFNNVMRQAYLRRCAC